MFKEKLEEALSNKSSDIKSFVWKGRKEEIGGQLVQKEIRLIDASQEDLRGFYEHCSSMLYNTNKERPGRFPLLDIIKEQRQKCNAELFIRWMEQEKEMPRYKFLEMLRTFLDNNKQVLVENYGDVNNCPISIAVGKCPEEFAEIPMGMILDGCLDKLGKFNKDHITLTFILKQGLWFTAQESKDLTEKDSEGNIRDKLEVAKERLNLTKPNITLFVTPKGLSFTQLRAMISLKSKKYSELTTAQLETLRNRILFSLEDEVKFHINQWETRIDQIKQVCEHKGFTL